MWVIGVWCCVEVVWFLVDDLEMVVVFDDYVDEIFDEIGECVCF